MATATKKKPPRRRKPAGKARAAAPDTSLTSAGPGDKLTDAQQTAVVQRLAMYDSPQTVVEWVKEEFDITITRQAIQHYDPTRGEKPAEKWCRIFEATRAAFLATTADIPIANKSVRLRRLERMALAAERQKNFVLAAALHEQAAKEVGDVYTNRTKVAVTDPEGGAFRVIVEEDSRGPTGGQS